MSTLLRDKTRQYGTALEEALGVVSVAPRDGSPLEGVALEILEMAGAYLTDGRHFEGSDDFVNALAAYAYGHGWLDAGARMGLFSVPEDRELFAI